MRPEADPSLALPTQEEERGPLGGLLHGAATAVATEATGSAESEAESARLGFEPEGIESGQLFGLGLAVVLGGLAIGAVWGAVFGFAAHAATRGQRDFSSVRALSATRYDVIARDGTAERARTMLGRAGLLPAADSAPVGV